MTTFYDWKFSSTLLLAFFGLKDKNWPEIQRKDTRKIQKQKVVS